MSDIKQIARKLLEAILYDNDMVNREEPLNEQSLVPWIERTSKALELPVSELGKSYFTDEWIEEFSCGDDSFMTGEIDAHPCLKELNGILNEFFEEY